MKLETTDRGREIVMDYGNLLREIPPIGLAQQSSAIGDYPDAMDRPGTSFLWIGERHHLNREQVAELSKRLQAWVKTGSMKLDGDK
jgi:hypothetical protein